jgi:His/Glu/Gln/Arg/opine family amino acid ABC transporter permease subunit
MPYKLDWAPIWNNRDLIVEGFLTTIALSGLVLALIIGVAVGTAGSSQARILPWCALKWCAAAYVELMRNIPLLVHMYFWYMGLAFLRLPPFACAVAALALYSGAYVAEVVRAGIGAVPQGQRLAALATGLTPVQAFRLVIYPQALRVIMPSLASVISQLIKDSSLASVITVAELTYEATAIEGQNSAPSRSTS